MISLNIAGLAFCSYYKVHQLLCNRDFPSFLPMQIEASSCPIYGAQSNFVVVLAFIFIANIYSIGVRQAQAEPTTAKATENVAKF